MKNNDLKLFATGLIIVLAGILMIAAVVLAYVWYGFRAAGLTIVTAFGILAIYTGSEYVEQLVIEASCKPIAHRVQRCKECYAKFDMQVYAGGEATKSPFTRCPICGGELIEEETDDEQMVS